MISEFSRRAIAASIAFAAAAASAPAAALDVKPGLWETTSRVQSHGQFPISEAELKKLTPQQRAALAQMEARSNEPRTHVYKSCLKKEDLEKDKTAFLAGKPGMKCTSKLSKDTSTSIAGTRHCTGGSSEESENFAFQARDREHVTGTVAVTLREGGRAMSSKGNLSSRWLGASCGKTK